MAFIDFVIIWYNECSIICWKYNENMLKICGKVYFPSTILDVWKWILMLWIILQRFDVVKAFIIFEIIIRDILRFDIQKHSIRIELVNNRSV